MQKQSLTPLRSLTREDVTRLIEFDYWGLRWLMVQRTRDPQIASDILNEAGRSAWEKKCCEGKLDHPAEIGGHILQVAGNLLRQHQRTACRARLAVAAQITADRPQDRGAETKSRLRSAA